MPDQKTMFSDQAPDINEQIAELERELEVRRTVYPRWVDSGKIKLQTANYRIQCLKATIAQLETTRSDADTRAAKPGTNST